MGTANVRPGVGRLSVLAPADGHRGVGAHVEAVPGHNVEGGFVRFDLRVPELE